MDVDSLLSSVLKKIKPRKDQIEALFKESDRIISFLKDKGYDARLMGSLAKGTILADNKEVDIFVFFDESVNKKYFDEFSKKVGKELAREFGGSYEIAYAEHPYAKVKIGKITFDVVPAYRISSTKHVKSAVDRTPFHVDYVRRKLKNTDDVLILKKFLKSLGIYGAEAKIQGFSGYLCELLIIHYGSFLNLIKHAANWKSTVFIDIENYYDILSNDLRKKFENAPLIVIDPVDKNRNVAAAVSERSLNRFVKASKLFLRKPSGNFFFPKVKVNLSDVKKLLRNRSYVFIIFKKPNVVEDVLWPQLRRSANAIAKLIQNVEKDFKIIKCDVWANNNCVIFFELNTLKLSKEKKHYGPPLTTSAKNRDKFIEKYENSNVAVLKPWIERNRWVVLVKRKYFRIEDLIRKELAYGTEALIRQGIAKYIAKVLNRGFNIKINDEIDVRDKEFLLLLSEHVKGELWWLP